MESAAIGKGLWVILRCRHSVYWINKAIFFFWNCLRKGSCRRPVFAGRILDMVCWFSAAELGLCSVWGHRLCTKWTRSGISKMARGSGGISDSYIWSNAGTDIPRSSAPWGFHLPSASSALHAPDIWPGFSVIQEMYTLLAHWDTGWIGWDANRGACHHFGSWFENPA